MPPPAVPDFAPGQLPPNVAFASVMPLGSVSTSAALSVAAVALLLVRVIVSTLVPPALIVAGAKALATVGALAFTVSVAVAGAALLPLFVCKAPAAIVFAAAPGVLLVTFAVIVQVPGVPPGIVAPEA